MVSGYINVFKPVGATASDVVVKLRRVLGERHIGHLGTLDPGACGVLPVAVGKGTKMFDLLTNKVKTYRATFTFGKTTDTLDSYGVVTETSNVIPDMEAVRQACTQFLGNISQVPPIYSAISVGGVRSYNLARQGVQVELKSRQVKIYSIDLVRQYDTCSFVIDIKCSGGTYIRSIARDLASNLGSVAYMSALIRLASGCWDINDALTYDDIERLGVDALQPILHPFDDIPIYEIDSALQQKLDYGVKLPVDFVGLHKIYCNNTFYGLGYCEGGKLNLRYYLK